MLANKLMGAGGAGGAGPASDTLTWRSRNVSTYTGSGLVRRNNGSISSVDIGTAASDRWVFVIVTGFTGNSYGSRQVNSITIAGGAATISSRDSNVLFMSTGWRLVTAGTTCDISFTLNSNGSTGGNAAITVWTINAATVSLVVSDEDGGFSAPGTKTLFLNGSHTAGAFALIATYSQNASQVTYNPGTTRFYEAAGNQIGDHIFPDAGTNPRIVVPYSNGGANYQWASLFGAT
jgi:hypothetical protein